MGLFNCNFIETLLISISMLDNDNQDTKKNYISTLSLDGEKELNCFSFFAYCVSFYISGLLKNIFFFLLHFIYLSYGIACNSKNLFPHHRLT